MPSRQRGWVLVAVGGLGSVGGYLAASGFSAWLEPLLSWRIMWFLNLPTGLVLIFLNRLIPESPKFLAALGHWREAEAMMRRFGCVVRNQADVEAAAKSPTDPAPAPTAARPRLTGTTWALSVAALDGA
jgi:putative MFS transporter